MGHFKVWSLAAIFLLAWIPFISGGPSSKNAIKLVKPPVKNGPPEKNLIPAASRRQQTSVVSAEDEENYSGPGQRPSFGPFPQGFSQGPPPPRYFSNGNEYAQDEAQDRFDVEEAPQGEGGMGFMPEFGPPKGFPDLSKLTGGEFPKMGTASSTQGNYESSPQYAAYQESPSPKYNSPFPLFPQQGGPQYYDESDDGPTSSIQSNHGPSSGTHQGAPKRRPFRSGRPGHRGGNHGSFGGSGGPPSGLGGPGPYGAPEGIGGPNPYGSADGLIGGGPGGSYGGSPSGLDGPGGRPFGRPSRPSFGGLSDGPSSRNRPFGGRPDGPSQRPGLFGGGPDGPSNGPALFNNDGPSSRPNPFIGSSDGPSSPPGLFGGGSDGPSRPSLLFGGSGDGPSSRPGLFGPAPNFDSPSDGPYDGPEQSQSRPSSVSTIDGPSRPNSFLNIGGSPVRLNPFRGSPSRPEQFGGPENSSGRPGGPGPYGGPENSSGRPGGPGPYGGPENSSGRPGGPGPYGGPENSSGRPGGPGPFGGLENGSGRPGGPGPYGGGPDGPNGRPGGHGPYGGPDGPSGRPGGRHEAPPAYSFSNSGPSPNFRLSRGYPRYHPNQIQNDDFKESADNADFSPFGNGPNFNYPPPSRQHSGFRPGPGPASDDYEQSSPPYPHEGPHHRPRSRQEFAPPPQHAGSQFGSTHRYDVKRPIVLKVSSLKSKYSRELPPGPPVFYAPSPDMKTKDNSRKFQESKNEKETNVGEASSLSSRAKSYLAKSRAKRDLGERLMNSSSDSSSSPCKTGKERGCVSSSTTTTTRAGKKLQRRIQNVQRAPSSSRQHQTRKSARRSNSKTNGTRSSSPLRLQDPMLADGTQQQGFWEVSPQPAYGTYNTNYKKQSAPALTAQERQDEYEIEDDDEGLAPPPAVPTRTRSGSRKNQTFVDTTSDEQRFFPSFPAPPSPYLSPFNGGGGGGFGRPPLFPGPTANRAPSRFHPQFGPKYTAPPPNRGPSSAYPAESHDRYLHTNLLGSGNFEVVRGGTYYGDDGDDGYHHATGTGAGHYQQDDDDGYFHHNGHASPHGYRNNPSGGGGDFFANFRDFADINPPTRSFSHHMETVADGSEPRGSATSHEQPKNILDKLESSSDKIEVHQVYPGSSSKYASRDSDPMMATF